MNTETRYAYQKKIKKLEARNRELQDDLYTYRTCVHEIYEGIKDVSKTGTTINISWLLIQIKRCLK